MDKHFWKGKKVFITGHTGFKGAWLCMWLHLMGAKVTGYALKPPTSPSLYELCKIDGLVDSIIADVRDAGKLAAAVAESVPHVVIHMAAQSLVQESYKNPAETFAVNVMGTVNLLEAVRKCPGIKAVVNVTTDKCYENREWWWGYRENEPLGGYDPYSSSKACSEFVTSAYRNSFFNPKASSSHQTFVASARAGNVIGGGDWAADRLVPDCIRAFTKHERIVLRNPRSIRPWQHVLEPLSGYLFLAERLFEDGPRHAGVWNFGPDDSDAKTVEWIVKRLCAGWPGSAGYELDSSVHPHEAGYLKLDCSKAKSELGWHPRWTIEKAIDAIIAWSLAYKEGKAPIDECFRQINEYSAENV